MELSLEFWYLFPISVLIATIAMSTGIGGAVFFSPLFMLALKLDPKIAIGAALVTELFGFLSGLAAYYRSKLIDFSLAGSLLLYSVPAAMLGAFYADTIPPIVLKAIFAVGLVVIGFQLFNAWRAEERAKKELEHRKEFEGNYESELIDATGRVHHYTVCNKPMGKAFAAVGGAFVGMISVGLAELQEYHLVARCKVPTPVAVGTSIFVVVLTVLVASFGHFYEFAKVGGTALSQVLSIVVFTAPGVVLGGQIGPRLQKNLPEDKMKVSIAVLFMLLGAFMLYTLTI
ncbi:MAG: TSUP family transporter [Bacteroidetes bacterium]|jgi:uncharacterized membrane protein YfcA|nr:TSUP family transporter [Bacteroidota bacterium]